MTDAITILAVQALTSIQDSGVLQRRSIFVGTLHVR
jgi:hypothetical protein